MMLLRKGTNAPVMKGQGGAMLRYIPPLSGVPGHQPVLVEPHFSMFRLACFLYFGYQKCFFCSWLWISSQAMSVCFDGTLVEKHWSNG